MDFIIASVDFDSLILVERNKLWNEKQKLTVGPSMVGLSKGLKMTLANVKTDVPSPSVVNQLDSNCIQISCIEKKDFEGDHQRKENRNPSSPLASTSEPRMRTMVRHGEYSPLNPNFLSPGKFILGLGEYEERRRLLMVQKKHEYKEYLSQVRLLVNSRNGNPTSTQQCHSETKQKHQETHNEDKHMEISNSKSIQVSENLPYSRDHRNVPDIDVDTITTHHKGIQIQIPVQFLQECIQKDVEKQGDLKLSSLNVSRTQCETGVSHSTPVENLSPREKKLADLQVSEQLSKMFFETSQETNPAQMSATDAQTRRQSHSAIYKEELRQQIEDKRKLEFELREKEKKEEEAINRRVQEQQEKIRLEYLKEEANKLEIQKQRVTDFKEQPDQQQRCLDTNTSHKVEISRPIPISNLEEYYPNNVQEHPVLLPETNAAHIISSMHTVQHEPQLNDGLRQSINANHLKKNHIGQDVSHSVKLSPNLHFKSKSFVVIDSTVSNDSAFLKSYVEGDGNRLWKPTNRSAEVKSCKSCNLEDSLPIPLFRSTSPVNISVDISATGANRQSMAANNRVPESSQAMKKLEAKWQIPAVEKNNISRTTHQVPGGSRQKNVLTQLGAFRRQLQLEQIQSSEGLKKIRGHRILK